MSTRDESGKMDDPKLLGLWRSTLVGLAQDRETQGYMVRVWVYAVGEVKGEDRIIPTQMKASADLGIAISKISKAYNRLIKLGLVERVGLRFGLPEPIWEMAKRGAGIDG